MPFKTIYESDFYKIEADLEGDLLRAQWLRSVTEGELKTGGVKLYEVLRDTGVKHAMANAQSLGILTSKTKEWMVTTFYELLSQTQLQKLARVLPHNLFYRIALESVVTRAEALGATRFNIKNFVNQDEAISWLMR